MIFQLIASFLMIIALEMYHAYDQGDPSRKRISQVLQFKDIAVACLYLSRFLSGCSAGKCVNYSRPGKKNVLIIVCQRQMIDTYN